MRHTLTVLVSAASICAFAFPVAASANVGNSNHIKAQARHVWHHPRMVHHVRARPAHIAPAVAGATAGYQTAAAPGYGYGYGGPFWPLGAAVEAPFSTAGAIATAPAAGLAPVPAAVGSCELIAGNRVCFGAPAWGYGPNYGYAPGGPIGAVIAAPFNAAATVAAAPVAATGAVAAEPLAPVGVAAAPAPAVSGQCQMIAGNRVCTANYGYAPGGPIEAAIAAPFNAAANVAAAPVAATTP